MTSARRLLAVVAVLGLAAPAARGDEACTLPNPQAWSAYRSKHFDLLTDASRFKAELLVSRLERTQALVVKAMVGDEVELPGRVRVLAFDSPADFLRLAELESGDAIFTSRGFTETPTIVLHVAGLEADGQVVAHMLAHHLSRFLFPRQPAWFYEGLAAFVETVGDTKSGPGPEVGTHLVHGSRRAGGFGKAGLPAPNVRRKFKRVVELSPKALLEWSGPVHDEHARFHLWSWLLYHWLWNERSRGFGDFTGRLEKAEAPAAAWLASFPDLDPAKPEDMKRLGDELERYLWRGRYLYVVVEATAEVGLEPVALSRADVHLAVLETRSWGKASKDEVQARLRAGLAEALREAPGHAVATAWLAQLDGASPLAALRARTEVAPADGWAWLGLASALGAADGGAEKEAALRKAATLLPDAARAQNALARQLAEGGRAREALPFANRAADLAPWNPAVLDTLAAVAGKLGQCPQALTLQRRALDLVRGAAAEGYRERLAELEARCADAAKAQP